MMDSMFDIDSVPQVPLLVREYEYQEYTSGKSEADLRTTTAEINLVMNEKDSFVYMPEAYLEMKVKLVAAAGGADFADAVRALGSGWHCFKEIQLYAGTELVQRIRDPGQVATILGVAESSRDELEAAKQELIYVDQPETDAAIPTVGIARAKAGAYNPALALNRAGGTGTISETVSGAFVAGTSSGAVDVALTRQIPDSVAFPQNFAGILMLVLFTLQTVLMQPLSKSAT